jgi:tetratricopeptide (TPR) repeat protein
MKPTSAAQAGGPGNRPIGFLEPTNERANLALKAIRERRLGDAAKHVAGLAATNDLEHAWRCYLRGLLAVERADLPVAMGHFGEALEHLADEDGSYICPRLAAATLEQTGRIHRRQEHAEIALAVHTKAYVLRQSHGSSEDLWETALALGHAAQLSHAHAQAQKWFNTAVRHASAAGEHPDRLLGIAYAALAAVLTDGRDDQEAVAAARRALHHWSRHDPGSPQTARARLALGRALLHAGERLLHNEDEHAARPVLAEALGVLTTACEELEPFGSGCAPDLATGLELMDFAQRLATHPARSAE